ncbi:MAG: hypothetical protein IJN83_05085 [Clostridia bacterium]|nr:hypothetical protein [Clostridia bacterium]
MIHKGGSLIKKHGIWFIALFVLLVMAATGCSYNDAPVITTEASHGKIFLYGENHGSETALSRELTLWQGYYNEDGMRHLFVELPYYTAEYLNLFMQAEDDAILEEIYQDWAGSHAHSTAIKDFYRQIKETCPETVFHGTDVGHQYDTTGARYLAYLESRDMEDTIQYTLAKQAIEQGRTFYGRNDYEYRENRMVENFVREFDGLSGESIMGIYGAAHTAVDSMAYNSEDIPSMACQLYQRYADALHSVNLKEMIEPLRTDIIEIKGKSYQAAYFGKQDLSAIFPDYMHREFWRLENSYADFESHPKTGDVLPYDNFPVFVESNQVFVIDYTLKNGEIQRKYYRSDGTQWQGEFCTEEFTIE